MAIYHFSVKIVSRGKGQSAVAKAAYNSRERMTDERTGETHDYRRKGGIAFEGIFAPEDAPDWVHDRAELYNEIERAEKRKDAQLLREVEIGLPHELTEEQREGLVKDFVREQFVRKGMVADVAIHEPDREGDERNHHAHILLTMREIGPDGFGDKVREWNGKEQLEEWREAWERTANRYLGRFGHEERIDHRSLEEQGVMRAPTQHQGPDIRQIEARGLLSEVEERREAERAGEGQALIELTALRAESVALAREEMGLLDGLQRDVAGVKELSPAVADIRLAYALSDSASAFREALAERGFWLARANADDVWQSRFEHGSAESNGRYAPILDINQVVALDTRGHVFAFGRNATGESRDEVAAFLTALDAEPLPSIGDTRAEFRPSRGLEGRAGEPSRTYEPSDAEDRGPGPEQFGHLARSVAGELLMGLARGAEGVFGLFGEFGAGKPDPAVLKARATDRAERAEAERADWQRYLKDADYAAVAARHEAEERARDEREAYTRQSERER